MRRPLLLLQLQLGACAGTVVPRLPTRPKSQRRHLLLRLVVMVVVLRPLPALLLLLLPLLLLHLGTWLLCMPAVLLPLLLLLLPCTVEQ